MRSFLHQVASWRKRLLSELFQNKTFLKKKIDRRSDIIQIDRRGKRIRLEKKVRENQREKSPIL